MRCLTISTAETYDLHGLAMALEEVEFINFYTDSLHAAYKEWDIFIFLSYHAPRVFSNHDPP